MTHINFSAHLTHFELDQIVEAAGQGLFQLMKQCQERDPAYPEDFQPNSYITLDDNSNHLNIEWSNNSNTVVIALPIMEGVIYDGYKMDPRPSANR